MDVDFLITAIYERPAIWDKNTKEHSNRNAVDRAWKEICLDMNEPEAVLRKKWKSLRDYFIMEHNKRSASRTGDGADSHKKSKWLYYNQLLFLTDQIAPKMCAISLDGVYDSSPGRTHELLDDSSCAPDAVSTVSEDYYTKTIDVMDQDHDPTSPSSSQHTLDQASPDQRPARKRKRENNNSNNTSSSNSANNPYDEFLQAEHLRLKYLSEKRDNEEDTDILFWKSLLPYVKQIPQHLKLSFRNRVQLTVEEFALGSQNGIPCRFPKDIDQKFEHGHGDSD